MLKCLKYVAFTKYVYFTIYRLFLVLKKLDDFLVISDKMYNSLLCTILQFWLAFALAPGLVSSL